MINQFKIYKKGTTTNGKVTIVSKEGEPFNRKAKIEKYQYLGYKVYDMNDKLIRETAGVKRLKLIKVNVDHIKVVSVLITWNNEKVKVLEIRTDKKLKPLVVMNKSKKQFYHYSQINKIVD
jgi:hypothetical protein